MHADVDWGAETLPLLSRSNREGHLGRRSDFQNQREDLCRYCSGTAKVWLSFNVQRKLLRTSPNALGSSQRLIWPAINGLRWKPKRPCKRRSSGACFGNPTTWCLANFPRKYSRPRCSRRDARTKRKPKHSGAAKDPRHLKASALRRATTSDMPQSRAHQPAPYGKSALEDALCPFGPVPSSNTFSAWASVRLGKPASAGAWSASSEWRRPA